MATADSMDIYQLKIALKRFKPPVWRRVQMKKDSTFKDLHHVIMSVMSWSNTHMYLFSKPRQRGVIYDERDELEIGTVSKDKDTGMERAYSEIFRIRKYNDKLFKLTDYFKAPKDLIEYDYDGWHHVITLEKILPSISGKEYPICVTGRRGHPPEHGPPESDEEYDSDAWQDEVFDPKAVTFKSYKGDDWAIF